MKKLKLSLLLLVGMVLCLNLTSCSVDVYYDDDDCVGTWFVTFNYDNWGNYDDGGIMVMHYNGYYEYYSTEYDYRIDRVGYFGRWWVNHGNLFYTYGTDTYNYRIVSQNYDSMRLRNNQPPGDTEIWYRY